jgi:arylformamidase
MMNDILYQDFNKADLESAYDNRGHVPDCEGMFTGWDQRSRDYRARANTRLDVSYGPSDLEALDIFIPEKPSGAVHAFIHGGYWRALDKADFSYVCEPLVDAGAIVASVNYGLCPAVSVEAIVQQTREATAWLYRNAAELGGDSARLHLSGHSAGAHLAVMMMATDWKAFGSDLPADPIKSVTAISGVYDLDPIPHLSANADIRLDAAMARRLSPMFMTPIVDVPLSVFVGLGELDEFVRQSKDFAADWTGKLSHVAYTELPGLNHFTIVDTMDRADDPITARMIAHMK